MAKSDRNRQVKVSPKGEIPGCFTGPKRKKAGGPEGGT